MRNLQDQKYRDAKEQRLVGVMVLGIGLPVGLTAAAVGGSLCATNICIMGCDDSRRTNMKVGVGLAIAGGLVALGTVLFGALMLSEANQQLERLGRLEICLAPAPGGLSAGARWSF